MKKPTKPKTNVKAKAPASATVATKVARLKKAQAAHKKADAAYDKAMSAWQATKKEVDAALEDLTK